MSLLGGGGSDFDIRITADGKSAVDGIRGVEAAVQDLDAATKSSSASMAQAAQVQGSTASSMAAAAAKWAAGLIAVSQVGELLSDSVHAAIEDEKALSNLRATMASVGEAAATDRLAAYADHLQTITTISAESIQGLEALAANLGVATPQIEGTIQAVIGLLGPTS